MDGDVVQATNIPGDHWRHWHDQIKHVIGRLYMWAGLPCEKCSTSSGLIPNAGLARINKKRQRQAIMVPDTKISQTVGGVTSLLLHVLKVINSNQTRYKPSWK